MRKRLLCASDSQYSMRKQCQLLGVSRSSLYNAPCQEDTKNLLYMWHGSGMMLSASTTAPSTNSPASVI